MNYLYISHIRYVLVYTLLSLSFNTSHSQPGGFIDQLYVDVGGLNGVVGLTFDENGNMYTWTKSGKIYALVNGVLRQDPLLDISEEVGDWRDFGMLGVALNPAYLVNGRIYLMYVVDRHHLLYHKTALYNASADEYYNATIGRITRYTTPTPGNCFQPCYKFGDLLKQQPQDGSRPSFPDTCSSGQIDGSQYDLFAHSKPAFDWGRNGNSVSRVSVNGAVYNVGMGPVSGPQWGGNCSIGGAWYMGDEFPVKFQNTYFHADYGAKWIRHLGFDANDDPLFAKDFDLSNEPIMAIASDPLHGGLNYIKYGNEIREFVYNPTGNQPPVAKASADIKYGTDPLNVSFTGSSSSDPEGGELTYMWNFDDGSTSSQPNPIHTFTTELSSTFSKDIYPDCGNVCSLDLDVQINQPGTCDEAGSMEITVTGDGPEPEVRVINLITLEDIFDQVDSAPVGFYQIVATQGTCTDTAYAQILQPENCDLGTFTGLYSLQAREDPSGPLSVTLFDPAHNYDTVQTYRLQGNSNGSFTIQDIPSGNYVIGIKHDQFLQRIRSVMIEPQRESLVDFGSLQGGMPIMIIRSISLIFPCCSPPTASLVVMKDLISGQILMHPEA